MTQPNAASTVHLDHLMFYGGFEMDDLFDFFERAGFFLTPLSRHSTGTVNRLAMLDHQYIEVLGFLPGTRKDVRPEIQAMPLGLNGLAAADAPGSHRRTHSGFSPPLLLERPVDTPDARGIAKFSITHVDRPVADARAFLCRHHTPELLWVKNWMQHRNMAVSIDEVCIPTAHVPEFKNVMDAVFDVPHDAADATQPTYAAQGSIIHVVPASSRALLAVRVRDLDRALCVVRESGLPHTHAAGQVTVPLPDRFRADLVFRPQ